MSMFWKILNLGGFGLGVWLVYRDKPGDKASVGNPFGMTFGNPVPGSTVTSGWGDDRSYLNTKHYGLDFRAAKGTPVYAVIGGMITTARDDNDTTAGKHVVVKTTKDDLIFNTRYLHLDKVSVDVGQTVKPGSVIGAVGDTYGPVQGGSAPHLHLDLAGNQAAVDRYKTAYGAPSGGFPDARSFGIQFPCEPFIQASYESSVRSRSTSRNIPVHK